jgi:hypothetical protein
MIPTLLLVGACGTGQQSTTPEDPILRLDVQAASSAMALERTEEAIAQYRRAFERARFRDDAAAIGDSGYDLAVAQLVSNQPKQALASIRMTRTELARRRTTSFPALDLAEATADYRVGEREKSDRLASEVEAGADATAAARATFLRGLVADDKGDLAGLEEAISRLRQPTSADQQADAAELLARHDLRQGAFEAADTEAEHAADLRRDILDYRGMARALAVAADAEVRAGDKKAAADLYMRAGQSAAAQGDAESARSWLRRSLEFANDPTLHHAARLALTGLDRSSSHPAAQ